MAESPSPSPLEGEGWDGGETSACEPIQGQESNLKLGERVIVEHWIRKPKAIVFIPVLLALGLAIACGASARPAANPTVGPAATTASAVPKAATAATPAPTTITKAKVARLVLAVPTPPHEINQPWLTSGSGLVQHVPWADELIGTDATTGEYNSTGLATKWEVSPDGKTWTFWLREGIPFHFGWGNFTGKDLEHSVQMWTRKEAIQTRTEYLQKRVDRFEHINN